MATTRSSPNGLMNSRSAVLGLCRAAFIGARWASAAPMVALEHGVEEPELEGPGLVMLYILAMVLVFSGGAFAGLTIAYVVDSYPSLFCFAPSSDPRSFATRCFLATDNS